MTRSGTPTATTGVIAVDLGGTYLKGAVFTQDGQQVTAARRPTGRDQGPAAVLATLLAHTAQLQHAATTQGVRVSAAGIAVPGLVDAEKGVARYSANLGWRDVPVRDLAAERLGIPVALGHDVLAGGVAESTLGAGRGVRELLFLAIGTGIAGTVVVDGRPVAGAAGLAGEIGHTPVRPEGIECACGQRGCLESYASAAAIARGYGGGVSAEQVVALAGRGDQRATRIWSEALDTLSLALASYTLFLDPELVVLGGGLAGAGAELVDPLRERLAHRLTFRPAPRLATAAFGPDAAIHGAALLAWDAAGAVPDATRWRPGG